MQDKEFALAKSLLTALSGRAHTEKHADSSSFIKAKYQSSSAVKASNSSRRHRFDDKSGPPAPRGSLTQDKLSYLDWRLKRINQVRQKSEGTMHCWIDGRDTIGRNSIDVAPSCQVAVQCQREVGSERSLAPASASAAAAKAAALAPNTIAAVIASEKAAGLKALEHGLADDSMLASMPRLSKRDSNSGSEMSGSSDQHALEAPAAGLDASSDRDVGGMYFTRPRKSFLASVGSRLSKSSKKYDGASGLASKVEATSHSTTARRHRSIACIWNR